MTHEQRKQAAEWVSVNAGSMPAEIRRTLQMALMDSDSTSRTRGALKEALNIMQEWSDNHDGEDAFGLCCPYCDGAVPLPHSFGCRARKVIEGKS